MCRFLKTSVLIIIITGCSQNKESSERDSYNGDSCLTYDGIWAENAQENALCIIKGDTIINVEHRDTMYFQITKDTMIIDYGDFKMGYYIVKFTKDSLILQNPDQSITRLYRK